jgi:transposase-like protein
MQSNSGRGGKKKPVVQLSQEVEADECYIVAGQKGQPLKVQRQKRIARKRRLKGKRGRGNAAQERNPVLGLVQRNGLLRLQVVENVKQKTIQPILEGSIQKNSIIYTDEYNIYNKVKDWGYEHKVVNHGAGQYAIDEDGDGFCEVHCNTQEGIWSLAQTT